MHESYFPYLLNPIGLLPVVRLLLKGIKHCRKLNASTRSSRLHKAAVVAWKMLCQIEKGALFWSCFVDASHRLFAGDGHRTLESFRELICARTGATSRGSLERLCIFLGCNKGT